MDLEDLLDDALGNKPKNQMGSALAKPSPAKPS